MVKKIKRRKTAYDFLKKFAELFHSRMKNSDTSLDAAVKDIPKIFVKYSVQDIASSLFVSSMWLPNIGSQIKHQLLAAIFAAIKPQDFLSHNVITSYDVFKKFLQDIYPLLPTFMILEDYLPEADWGQIKFYYDEKNYKIFYGNELSNVYDYLMQFQMIYLPFDHEYFTLSGKSPATELQHCLQLQDDIIMGIPFQPSIEGQKDVAPGHIEIPSQEFWATAIAFYNNYDPRPRFREPFLKDYSIQLGSWPGKYLQSNVFQEMASIGKILPVFFILHNGQYFPILPRRYSAVLFDSWSKWYVKYHDKVIRDDTPISIHIGKELHRYIKARVNSSFLYPLVSAVTEQGKPHEIFFHTAFISKDRLILIYVTNPVYSIRETEEELEKVALKLQEAIKLISTPPIKLTLNLDRQNVQFQGKKRDHLKPLLFIVCPLVSTEISNLSIPKNLPGRFISMENFLGIIDELENVDILASFIEYLEEYGDKIQPALLNPLDIFGSFKDSLGILVPGASRYDFISIDPHWGSRMRFETLSKFWKAYPEKQFFGHPRSWKVIKETESRTRLEAKGYFGAAIYCRVGLTHIFLNCPFHKLSYEQATIANLLMECLEDIFSRNNELVGKHEFFKVHDEFQVLFFPFSLVSENDEFSHLRHLSPEGRHWCSDYGFIGKGRYGIRVVFDDKLLTDALAVTKDRTLEVELIFEVLNQLNNIAPDPNARLIRDELEKQKVGKPRFKIQFIKKKAAFPEFISAEGPALGHFKRARKRIAELARECNLTEGYYTLENVKMKLNSLRESLVKEIDSEVKKFDFAEAIPFLLSRIDALSDQYERTTHIIMKSIDHEVDYNREEHYATQHNNYIAMHKNYRYLIEKFVQLQPQGQTILEKDQFQYLIAFIDWLLVIYSASDSLHYGINPVGMKVTSDFTVEVEYHNSI